MPFLELHPLALEDVFHTRGQNRSKADYYSKHLFLQVLCHELSDVDENNEPSFTDALRSTSPEPMEEDEEEKLGNGYADEEAPTLPTKKRRRWLPFLPDSRRGLEAKSDSQDSDSSLAKLLGANRAVSLSVLVLDGSSLHNFIQTNRAHRTQLENEVTLESLKQVISWKQLFQRVLLNFI